ncbi:DNA helicase, partial [Tanacetum coccineum]
MKTKRKLVPKDVVMGNIEDMGIVDIRASCLGHVGEGSQPFVVSDSQLGCLSGDALSGVQLGTMNTEGFCSVTDMIGQKRDRDSTPICGNVDGNGCSSSKRQHVSIGCDNRSFTSSNIDFTPDGGSLLDARIEILATPLSGNRKRSRDATFMCSNADGNDSSSLKRNSSDVHMSSENNRPYESSTCSYSSRKRARGPVFRATTSYVGNSSSSTRRLLSFGRDNLNTSIPNNDPTPAVDSSGARTRDAHMLSEDNRPYESSASSYSSRKRARGPVSRVTTSYVGNSSSSTRRSLSSNRDNLNTPTSNNDRIPVVDSSGTRTSNSGLGENRACPPLEYKYVGKCAHSCEHCGARFSYEERIKDTRRRSRPIYHRCSMAGRVVLRTYQIYLEYIPMLLKDRHFIENIRAYNQMFSMTSLGARVDESVNIGRGPYVFKISGQLYHWLGSLCPAEGDPPRFLQLYIYDTKNEVDNRMSHFGGDYSELRRDIVEGLIELLDNHNALVQLFRTAREKLLDSQFPPFKVRLFSVVGAREYELPTGDMLGAIVYEPGPDTDMKFPLLFGYGEDGYSKDMKIQPVLGTSSDEDRRLTMKACYSYMLHDHVNSFNYLSKTERLSQQYIVTAFCAVEQNRIDFIREHQNDIRNEYLSGIYDAIRRGDSDGSDCGGRLILPQSFTGSPRYMYAHYLDALAICRVHGNPSY